MYVVVSAFTNYANVKAMQKYTNAKCQKTLFVCLDEVGFHRIVRQNTNFDICMEVKYLGIFARPGYSSILLRVFFFLQMQTAFHKVLLPEVL